MSEKYVCTSCGSKTVNRRLDDTRLGGPRTSMQIPAYCSDPSCPNADPENHSLHWAKVAGS